MGLRRHPAGARARPDGRARHEPARPARRDRAHVHDGRLRGLLAARPRGDVLPRELAQLARAEAAGLALWELAVAAHVAALAAHDHVHGIAVAHVPDPPDGGSVHARHPALTEDVPAAVAELHLDAPAVHEVHLLLAFVEVTAGLESGRERDRVHAELGDTDAAANLAKAI